MELQTITEDQAAAQAAFREYRAAFMAERNRRMAIARADERLIRFQRTRGGAVTFAPDFLRAWGRSRAVGRRFALPDGTLPAIPADQAFEDGWGRQYGAILPLVPPRFRPPHSLVGYHLLWEAEWKQVVPRDPALLKHIVGDLFAVLAVWDLTDLERAVMEMRAA